jgi:hypothetical protein
MNFAKGERSIHDSLLFIITDSELGLRGSDSILNGEISTISRGHMQRNQVGSFIIKNHASVSTPLDHLSKSSLYIDRGISMASDNLCTVNLVARMGGNHSLSFTDGSAGPSH